MNKTTSELSDTTFNELLDLAIHHLNESKISVTDGYKYQCFKRGMFCLLRAREIVKKFNVPLENKTAIDQKVESIIESLKPESETRRLYLEYVDNPKDLSATELKKLNMINSNIDQVDKKLGINTKMDRVLENINKKPFACSLCSKLFKKESHLNDHKKDKHSIVKIPKITKVKNAYLDRFNNVYKYKNGEWILQPKKDYMTPKEIFDHGTDNIESFVYQVKQRKIDQLLKKPVLDQNEKDMIEVLS